MAVFQMPDCTGFLQEVDAAIAQLGGKVFPKLNWSSPQVTERERREEGRGADQVVCVEVCGGGDWCVCVCVCVGGGQIEWCVQVVRGGGGGAD